MPNTGFVRFSTVDSSEGFDVSFTPGDSPSPSNLITPNVGVAQENRTFKQVTLSGLDLNIPAGSTIDGIEYTFRAKYASIGLNYRISSSLFLEETQGTIHVNKPGSNPSNNALGFAYKDFTFGSSTTTEELTGLTTSNIENLKFKIQTGYVMSVTSLFVEGGSGTPAIKVYYTEPIIIPSKVLPGPNFMSSNVDLTKFKGLGDKTSPLQPPISQEDLFGFNAVIVPEGDNSSQATNSTFGDEANFGKLATNRGGGTGISSNTGLLDTSKAPLSVRTGFRGL